MPGLSDYAAMNELNWLTGQVAMPALPSVFAALFTVAPTGDAGTGGTEVSGGSYARQQVAGTAVTNGTTAAGNAILHFASTPAWIFNGTTCIATGFTVRDITTPSAIPSGTTILSATAITVTLSANAAGAGVGNGDTIGISAFGAAVASSGTEPAVTPCSATSTGQINFIQATANWGNCLFLGLYDAVTSGNYLGGDYLGNFGWLPATVSVASPGVITAKAHGYAAADNVVVTTKYGGTMPTFSQSNLTGTLAVVSPATDTFTVTNVGTAVNTATTGDLSVRKITVQSVPSGVALNLPAGQVVAYAA